MFWTIKYVFTHPQWNLWLFCKIRYGYSNLVDSEVKNIQAEVVMNEEVISTIKLLYNPISGYYFSQFEPNILGSYVFNIKDSKKLIDTINVNIFD